MSKTKDNTSLSANQEIRNAVRQIALRGLVNQQTKEIRGTGRICGYVAKIHTEGDLAGTIDVQEFLDDRGTEEAKLGYHEGVYLSAIQDNSKGLIVIPKLYSEVVITKSAAGQDEYVILFSHVDTIQLDSHETIAIEVKEREAYDENDEDSPDIEDLPETGVLAKSVYTKNSITTEVQDSDKANHAKQIIDGNQITQIVGDNESSISIGHKSVEAKHNTSKVSLTEQSADIESGSSKVKVTDGMTFVGSDTNTDDAVLGVALAQILSDLINLLSQITTPTMMGPQCTTVMAQFIALKAKIDTFKSSHTGFLTNKVQIQK